MNVLELQWWNQRGALARGGTAGGAAGRRLRILPGEPCWGREDGGSSLCELVVQWLGLCTYTAGGLGSISDGGTKIPLTSQCNQKTKQNINKQKTSSREAIPFFTWALDKATVLWLMGQKNQVRNWEQDSSSSEFFWLGNGNKGSLSWSTKASSVNPRLYNVLNE